MPSTARLCPTGTAWGADTPCRGKADGEYEHDIPSRVLGAIMCAGPVNCNQAGSWEKVVNTGPMVYAGYLHWNWNTRNKWDSFKKKLFVNGFKMYENAGHLIKSWDDMPLHRDESVGVWTCRATIVWDHERYTNFLTSLLWMSSIQNPAAIGYLSLPDGGFSVVRGMLESKIYPSMNVEYKVRENSNGTVDVSIDKHSPLWNDN